MFCSPHALVKDPLLLDSEGRRFSPGVLQAPQSSSFSQSLQREQAGLSQASHPLPTLVKKVMVQDHPGPVSTIMPNASSTDV